jgi:flavin-binding protein dodecin
MAEKVFKKITVTGCSDKSYEQAIRIAVAKASESLHGLAWFEVTEMRGGIRDDGMLEFQATVDVAFRVD